MDESRGAVKAKVMRTMLLPCLLCTLHMMVRICICAGARVAGYGLFPTLLKDG